MKVAMIGGAAHPSLLRPEYEGYEFWGLNAMRPQWTAALVWARWFNIHRWDHLVRDWKGGLDAEVEWAKKNPQIPFYTPGDWGPGGMPNEVPFPRDELNAAYPRPDYHAGSFDWMVAFALYLGATDIALHGVRLHCVTGEPESARACLEYWCGFAEGRGCRIYTAEDCDLFWQYHIVRSHSVYGYDDVHMLEEQQSPEFWKGEATRRGWTTPAKGSPVDAPQWVPAWVRYWIEMERYERQVAAGETDPGRPIAPHRSG